MELQIKQKGGRVRCGDGKDGKTKLCRRQKRITVRKEGIRKKKNKQVEAGSWIRIKRGGQI